MPLTLPIVICPAVQTDHPSIALKIGLSVPIYSSLIFAASLINRSVASEIIIFYLVERSLTDIEGDDRTIVNLLTDQVEFANVILLNKVDLVSKYGVWFV